MVYFLYSEQQIVEKNNILARTNKKFEPGTVVINGKRVKFSQISNQPIMPRFIDTKIIACGESTSDFTYIPAKSSSKKGN